MALRLFDYAASPNCYKVRLLLAQLGLEYERVPVDIFAGDTMTPEYARKNPGLTTPVLELETGEHLPESNAILLHLAEGTELLPTDEVERAQVYRWLFYEQATVVPQIGGLRFRLATGRLDPDSDATARAKTIAAAVLATVESHLRDREFFVADRYTVADLCMYGYLHAADESQLDLEPFPNLRAWLERVRAQPGHVGDLVPIPPTAHRDRAKSIYDALGV